MRDVPLYAGDSFLCLENRSMEPVKRGISVLVCGGRDYNDTHYFLAVMNRLHEKRVVTTVIQGGARGADCMAVAWALFNEIPVIECKADWKKHGKKAGPIRNAEMLKHDPDLVIAFPGGRGTSDMLKQAQKAGIEAYALKGREPLIGCPSPEC